MAKTLKLQSSSNVDSSSSDDGHTKSPPPKSPGSDSDGSRGETSVPRKSPRSESSHQIASPTKTSKKRRIVFALEQDTSTLSKKEKVEREDKGKNSTPFHRLWSEDDEIVILEGILRFKDEKETDPMENKDGFYDFIKGCLHVEFDRRQLMDKVRKLKKRYENSLKKTKFTAHEQTCFNLSKKIWGKTIPKTADVKRVSTEDDGNVAKTSNENADSVESSWQFIGKSVVSMGMNEDLVKIGLKLCTVENKAKMEDKWKKVYMEEAHLFFRKLELAKEESKMINDALNSAGK